MSDSLWPHGLQHVRLPCPSLSPGVCSDSCPYSQWYHPTISSSVAPFLLLPSTIPSIRVFSKALVLCIRWSKFLSFSFSISPSNEYSELISFKIGNARVWAHWNHSFQMHLTYLEPVSCFHILSLLSSGLTTGNGCSLMAARLAGMLLLPEFRYGSLAHTEGCVRSMMTVTSLFTNMARK